MGFRFRKSFKLAKGVRVNLGKRGASLSLGGRGATVNVGAKGVRGTVGIPGTGISYSTPLSGPSRRPSASPAVAGTASSARVSGWSLFWMVGVVFWLIVGLAMGGIWPWLLSAVSLLLSIVVGKSAQGMGPSQRAFDRPAEAGDGRDGPGAGIEPPLPTADLVYLNTQSNKFHQPGCRYAMLSATRPVTRSDALLHGSPCMICH